MNKENTPVSPSTPILGTPSTPIPGKEPAKVFFLTATPLTVVVPPGFGWTMPQSPAPSSNPPAARAEPETVRDPAWRDPSTFLGELRVHLVAGIILMGVTFVAAHLVVRWH
jgi:hypothetical protein